MENKVIWAVLHLQTKETGKSCTQSRNLFHEKWPNLGYGKMWKVVIEVLEKSLEFSKLYLTIGSTVSDYFKDTITPHFFHVAIRCIVLIKLHFLKLDTPPLPRHCFCIIEWFDPASTPLPPKKPQQSTLPVKLLMCRA